MTHRDVTEDVTARIEHLIDPDNVTDDGWKQALDLAEQFVIVHPFEGRGYLALARVLSSGGHPGVAKKFFERATALLPADRFGAAAWLGLSVVQELSGDLPEALVSMRRACAITPDNVDLLLRTADLLRELHEYEDAEAAYNRVLEVRPQWAEARFMRSFLYFRTGRWREGWNDYLARWDSPGFYRTANLTGMPAGVSMRSTT